MPDFVQTIQDNARVELLYGSDAYNDQICGSISSVIVNYDGSDAFLTHQYTYHGTVADNKIVLSPDLTTSIATYSPYLQFVLTEYTQVIDLSFTVDVLACRITSIAVNGSWTDSGTYALWAASMAVEMNNYYFVPACVYTSSYSHSYTGTSVSDFTTTVSTSSIV